MNPRNTGHSAILTAALAFASVTGAIAGDPPYLDLLERQAAREGLPVSFLAAVMMAESRGNPNAVGDQGCSVGLFQLNGCGGMGNGMGDSRYDPVTNSHVAARFLGVAWTQGAARGLSGEALVRYAYDRFNPGGGYARQGNEVLAYWRVYEPTLGRAALYARREADPTACAQEAALEPTLAKDCSTLAEFRTWDPGFHRQYMNTWLLEHWTEHDVACQYAYEKNRDIDARLGRDDPEWREKPHLGVFLTACAEESSRDPFVAKDCSRFEDLKRAHPGEAESWMGSFLPMGWSEMDVRRRWAYERNRDIDTKIGQGDPDWRSKEYGKTWAPEG